MIRNVKRKELPFYMRWSVGEEYLGGVEVCYWRKHWGLRNWFLSKAFPNDFDDPDNYEYKLDVEKVTILWRMIIHYLRHPEDWANNFWDFKEVRRTLYQQRWNLWCLRMWMKRHPDAEVVFYDSY